MPIFNYFSADVGQKKKTKETPCSVTFALLIHGASKSNGAHPSENDVLTALDKIISEDGSDAQKATRQSLASISTLGSIASINSAAPPSDLCEFITTGIAAFVNQENINIIELLNAFISSGLFDEVLEEQFPTVTQYNIVTITLPVTQKLYDSICLEDEEQTAAPQLADIVKDLLSHHEQRMALSQSKEDVDAAAAKRSIARQLKTRFATLKHGASEALANVARFFSKKSASSAKTSKTKAATGPTKKELGEFAKQLADPTMYSAFEDEQPSRKNSAAKRGKLQLQTRGSSVLNLGDADTLEKLSNFAECLANPTKYSKHDDALSSAADNTAASAAAAAASSTGTEGNGTVATSRRPGFK